MNRITCNVVTDLLELYADEIVSEDTKNLVDEHLCDCVKCNEKLMQIKQTLKIPAEVNAEPIKKIKRKIKKKNIIVSLISIFIVAGIFIGAFFFITQHKIAIPYESTHIYNVEQGENDWEIKINFMDNIDEYATTFKRLDDTTMEYYVFFYDTYSTRYFSNRIAMNSTIYVPAYEGMSQSPGGELIEVQTVRIYYCTFTSGSGRTDFSEKYLIWEKTGGAK